MYLYSQKNTWRNMKIFLKKFKQIFVYIFYKIYFLFFNKKIKKNDRFGLSYYVWRDTRPIDTFLNNVRTDDTTVISVIKIILENNLNKSDNNYFDIGAYIGIITLAFNRFSNNNCKIHSFEPFEKNFLRLKKNIKLNNLENVYLNNYALGDKKELVTLKDTIDPGMASIVVDNRQKDKNLKYETIRSDTLEAYILKKNISKINFIKIDTEGYDYKILEGSENLLKKSLIDYLIVEYIDKSAESKKVIKILKNNGYKIFYLLKNKGKITDDVSIISNRMHEVLNILAISGVKSSEVISSLKL